MGVSGFREAALVGMLAIPGGITLAFRAPKAGAASPGTPRVILLSFYLRMLSRGAMADKGK